MESSLLDFGYALGESDVLQGLAAVERCLTYFGHACGDIDTFEVVTFIESTGLDTFQFLWELDAFEICELAEHRQTYLGHAVWNDNVLFLTCIP